VILRAGQVEAVVVPFEEYRALKALNPVKIIGIEEDHRSAGKAAARTLLTCCGPGQGMSASDRESY
jgi:hypothetical protein